MSYLNENLGISNKAKISNNGKMYLTNMINSNQKIRRLTRYLTKTPLSSKGMTYSGELIEQPDLEFGLLDELKPSQDKTAIGREVILVPYAFDEELLEQEKIFIFVSSPRSKFRTGDTYGDFMYEINVVYSKSYEKILPVGTERSAEIFSELCSMFDQTFTDGEFAKKIGNIKFDILDFGQEKISTQGYIKNTMILNTKIIVDRRIK